MADQEKPKMMTLGADGLPMMPEEAAPLRVVRTLASDMAKLSGTGAPPKSVEPAAHEPAGEVPPTPSPAPLPAPVVLPEVEPIRPTTPVARPEPASPPERPRVIHSIDADLAAPSPVPAPNWVPPVVRAEPPRTPKEPGFFIRILMSLFGTRKHAPDEGRVLTSTIVREAKPKPAPPPLPVAPVEPAPPVPASPPAPVAPPPSLNPDAEREAVLARLRARVASREGEAPPPVFPTPRPEPPKAPVRPMPPPPPPNLPGVGPAPASPEPLQTMSGDFAKRVERERASSFAVMAADADRANRPPPRPVRRPDYSLAYIVLSTVLIVGGSTSLYLAYDYFSSRQPVAPKGPDIVSLLAADEEVAVRKEDGDAYRLFRDAAEKPLANGSIRVIYYTVATSTPLGTADVPQAGTVFLSAMRLRAPDLLTRNVGPETTLGSVGSSDEAHPFFVLASYSYQRTFAGMLAWEATMPQDLALLYPDYAAASVDASSTPTVSASSDRSGTFRDEVVESYDVRVLRDPAGRSLMLYGYRDPETLIIVRDEEAFKAVLTRFTGVSRQ